MKNSKLLEEKFTLAISDRPVFKRIITIVTSDFRSEIRLCHDGQKEMLFVVEVREAKELNQLLKLRQKYPLAHFLVIASGTYQNQVRELMLEVLDVCSEIEAKNFEKIELVLLRLTKFAKWATYKLGEGRPTQMLTDDDNL